jgi:hypothetical protein
MTFGRREASDGPSGLVNPKTEIGSASAESKRTAVAGGFPSAAEGRLTNKTDNKLSAFARSLIP